MVCGPTVLQPYGNILTVASISVAPTGSDLYPGRTIFTADTFRTYTHDGTDWVIMAEPAQTWTPSFAGGVTVGNGAWTTAVSHRSDGWVDLTAVFTLGSTSAITGTVSITLPIAAAALPFDALQAMFLDFSAGLVYPGIGGNSTTTPFIFASTASGTYTVHSNLSSTVPFTWATSDAIHLNARYRMLTRYL